MVKSKLNKMTMVMPALTMAVAVAIHFQLIAEKPLTYVKQTETWKKGYEEKFRHYSTIPQPEITEIRVKADLHPETGFAEFTVDYTLTNKSDEMIANILVGRHGNLVDWSLEISAPKTMQSKRTYNHSELQLDEPMKAGDSVELSTHFTIRQPKLWPSSEKLILNGQITKISADYFLPVVGYQPSFEIKGKRQRITLGLPEQSTPLTLPVKALVNSVITTKHSHTIVPIGKLVEKRALAQRNIFRFSSAAPIELDFSWVSTPATLYKVEENEANALFFTGEKSRMPSSLVKSAVSDTINWAETYLPLINVSNVSVVYTPLLNRNIQAKDSTIFLSSDWVFKSYSQSSEDYSADHYGKMVRAVINSKLNPYDADSRMQHLMTSIIQLKIMNYYLGDKKTNEFLQRASNQYDNLNNLSQRPSATVQVISALLKAQSILAAQSLVSEIPHNNLIAVITKYIGSDINSFGSSEFLSNEGVEMGNTKREKVTRLLQSYFATN